MPSTTALALAAILTPAAALTQAALADTLSSPPAAQVVPGTVNYVEGAASLSGHALTPRSAGTAVLAAHGQLSTATGKVELLLAPGVFLRLGENSILRMVSPDLTHTELALEQGSAEVEVDQLFPQNNLLVDQGTTQTHLQKPGLYEFTANPDSVRVLDGKAASLLASGKSVEVKQGHLLEDSGDATHTSKFDRDAYSDPLTNWGDLRADYLNQNYPSPNTPDGNTESTYSSGGDPYPGGYGSSWLASDSLLYGNPYPYSGGFFSPLAFGGFGYPYGGFGPGLGFFGPGLGFGGGGLYGAGFFGGGLYGPGFFGGFPGFFTGGAPVRGGGYSGTFGNHGPYRGPVVSGPVRPGAVRGAYRAPAPAGGFHGGGSMGDFHGGGGMGGFHGGGGGGHR